MNQPVVKYPNRLAEMMERKGMSQAELARRLDIDRQRLHRWFQCVSRLQKEWAEKIAPILDTTPEILMDFPANSHEQQITTVPEDAAGIYKDGTMRPDAEPVGGAALDDVGPLRRGMEAWQVTSRSLEYLAIIPGDIVLVDTVASYRARDIVLAMVYGSNGTAPIAALRIYTPPVLMMANDAGTPGGPLRLDDDHVNVRGRVVKVIRHTG